MKRDTVTPAVGLYANHVMWSDVEPYEILSVSKSGSVITIRAMSAVLDPEWVPDFIPGGFCGTVVNQRSQRWSIEPDPEGHTLRAHRRKDGCYHSKLGRHVVSENPRKFYDYNF